MRDPRRDDANTASRRRNWLALTVALVPLCFSYFAYAAAFIPPEGTTDPVLRPELVGLAAAIAPFVFVAVGFLSQNARAPKRVLGAMGLLVAIGLAVGLLAPVLGIAAGFGVGIAMTLNEPGVPNVLRNRLLAVAFITAYVFALLVFITPAGVLSGALLPPMFVGLADEYSVWRAARDG